MTIYEKDQLKMLSDPELMEVLRESWGYDKSAPIEVIGVIKKVKTEDSYFYFLERILHVKTGKPLNYPLSDRDIKRSVKAFFNWTDAKGILNSPLIGTHVKAQLTLSPKSEREKHKNPIEVCVKEGSGSLLMAVPNDWNRDAFQDDENSFIEQWVIDHYFEKNKKKIEKDRQSRIAALERDKEILENKKVALEREIEEINSAQQLDRQQLQVDIDKKNTELSQIEQRIVANQKKHKKLIEEQKRVGLAIKEQTLELQRHKNSYQERMKEMESKLERLKEFIQEKSQTLINLGLLDEKEFMKLIGQAQKNTLDVGYDFDEDLGGDYKKAAAYIQAYMRDKSIYYHRSVIEDFFALLRTNDLIILAGDSGCGKTNLVKSFADSIGGKSFIIPVKPNWTSAEDLLGYYNPLEKKYVITSFLTALIEAESDPETPYLICLDEMNLARVEYYFADFLSLLEERKQQPEIYLYSDDEAAHALEEYQTFLRLVDKVKADSDGKQLNDFVDFLQDEEVNAQLHKLCGFHEGDSLLNYHGKLRRILSGFINTPSSIKLPPNVRIIGAINVDDTTHYLSPKILDRAHVMKFRNPFLMDLKVITSEVEAFDDLDLSRPLNIKNDQLGVRRQYPELDDQDELEEVLKRLGREFLSKLGVEFGFRTVRQAKNYANELSLFSTKRQVALNNFILHKVLPKLMFEGEQKVGNGKQKKEVLIDMLAFLKENLNGLVKEDCVDNCLEELEELRAKAEANDWLVNYWVK
ncbi:McrB family protein [Paraferrimonas haliotis]|uniref:ATPase dynein-related AAA domain-containing protein n=1 Tax=Paraferrimonas haliotis TaxID=2013866 RepID=A0AA37WY98_9GAMM|nr:AAA family ATPase [Paraferrimonas haliotis]GLS83510.1 hypothetical protein GCM10007894_14870 [Paraferrimonas haliotis]